MSIVTSAPKEPRLDLSGDRETVLSSGARQFFSPRLSVSSLGDSARPSPSKQHFRVDQSPVIPSSLHLFTENDKESAESTAPGLSVESLMEALPAGLVVLDRQGRVQMFNPASLKLLGGLVKGQYWRDLISQKFEPRLDDGHEVSLKNGLRVSLSTRSVRDGSGQLIVINDLTETRNLQTQLSRHQRLSSMGRMMSSLAHQIRTPLSAALLHADNLMRKHKSDKPVAEAGRKIVSRLRNIERQIRDMLIFAKGGTTPMESCSAPELVESIKEAANDMAEYYGGQIVWQVESDSVVLSCNVDALIGAFLNLLENAFQASEPDSPVAVRITTVTKTSKSKNAQLSIDVINQGPGIDTSILQSPEQAFSTTKANGNGLGLAIVRLVCESHHGEFCLSEKVDGVIASMLIPLAADGEAV